MKKNIILCTFLLVCNTALSMDRFIEKGQVTLGTKTFPLCISQDPTYCLNSAQHAQRDGERYIPKSSAIYILPQKQQCILSTTDFGTDHITTAMLALHNDGTWYAAMQSYRNNLYTEHIEELVERLLYVNTPPKPVQLIRFITVSKITRQNTAYSQVLSKDVIDIVNRIQKPLQVLSFDYNEKKAVPFSKETPKDVEIYLNPDGTGFLYLNTTQEYIPLP